MKRVKKNQPSDPAQKLEWSDRLWLFWKGHQRAIGYTAAALCILLGIFAFRGIRCGLVRRAMEKEFPAACASPVRMVQFARSYGSMPLGSFTALMAANREIAQLHRREAARLLTLAETGAHGNFGGLADLLAAIQILEDGQWAGAETVLKRLLNDSRAEAFIRCGACYELALLNFLQDKLEEARGFLRTFETLPQSPFWTEKASLLTIFIDQ